MPTQQEFDALKADFEKLQKQHADVMAEGGSYRNLQVSLDAALQSAKDTALLHDKAINDLTAKGVEDSNALKKQLDAQNREYAANLQSLQSRHEAKLQQQADAAAKDKAQTVEKMKALLMPKLQAAQKVIADKQAADSLAQQKSELDALSAF